MGIYEIVNVTNGKRYVGHSTNLDARWYQHKYTLRKGVGVNPRFQAAWDKYGESAFEFRVLEVVENAEDLVAREQVYLDAKPAYNLALNAEKSALGRTWKLRPETRARMSVAAIGRPKSPEHKAKLAAANCGKKQSAESIAKRVAKMTGRKKSPEERARMSARAKGQVVTEEQRERMRIAWISRLAEGRYRKTWAPTAETRAKMSESAKARCARVG